MSEFENDVVAFLHTLQHVGPKHAVECARTCSAKRMILNSYLAVIVEVASVISPSPLTVVAVAERTATHS